MKNYHGFRFNTSNTLASYIFIQSPNDVNLYYCHPYRGDDLSKYENISVGAWHKVEIDRTILQGFWIPIAPKSLSYKEEL